MKFKSKKLTALAMAVLMAASTMSSAVFAEDVGVPAAVEAEVVVSDEATAPVDATTEEEQEPVAVVSAANEETEEQNVAPVMDVPAPVDENVGWDVSFWQGTLKVEADDAGNVTHIEYKLHYYKDGEEDVNEEEAKNPIVLKDVVSKIDKTEYYEIVEESKQTCESPRKIYVNALIKEVNKGTWVKSESVAVGKEKGHKFVEWKRDTITNETCTTPGDVHIMYKCANAGCDKGYDKGMSDEQAQAEKDAGNLKGDIHLIIPALGHNFSVEGCYPQTYDGTKAAYYKANMETATGKNEGMEYANPNPNDTFLEKGVKYGIGGRADTVKDGLPLVDKDEDGHYEYRLYCSRCNVYEIVRAEDIYAEKGFIAIVTLRNNDTSKSNIANDGDVWTVDARNEEIKLNYEFKWNTGFKPTDGKNNTVELPATYANAIEMQDCSKNGYFEVTYYNRDGRWNGWKDGDEIPRGARKIATIRYTIKAHHMEEKPVAEFLSEQDEEQCNVYYTPAGELVVENKSCASSVTYYKVTHCTAQGCPNKNDCWVDVNGNGKYDPESVGTTSNEKLRHYTHAHVGTSEVPAGMIATVCPVCRSIIERSQEVHRYASIVPVTLDANTNHKINRAVKWVVDWINDTKNANKTVADLETEFKAVFGQNTYTLPPKATSPAVASIAATIASVDPKEEAKKALEAAMEKAKGENDKHDNFAEKIDFLNRLIASPEAQITFAADPDCAKGVYSPRATCTTKGTIDIQYTCIVCGKKNIDNDYITEPVLGHSIDPDHAVITTIDPEANCEHSGLMTTVVKCDRCDEVFYTRADVEIPRTAHTNELAANGDRKITETTRPLTTDPNKDKDEDNLNGEKVLLKWNENFKIVIDGMGGDNADESLWKLYENAVKKGKTLELTKTDNHTQLNVDNKDGYAVYVGKNIAGFRAVLNGFTRCRFCENWDVNLHDDVYYIDNMAGKLTITVDSLKKETTNCEPGSITLTAKYEGMYNGQKYTSTATETFDYYSSATAYNGKVGHEWGPEKVLERVEPTLEAEGKIVYGRECTVCHHVDVTRTEVLPKLEPEVQVDKPAVVTGLKLEAVGTGRVNVSWDPVDDADYYVVLLHDSFEYKGVAKSVSAPKCNTSITGLDTEVFSHIWVAAVKKGVNGGDDVVGDAGQYQSILAREIPTVTGLKAVAEAGKINLSWKAQSKANTYSVAWKSTADGTVHKEVLGDDTTFTLENTTKNVGYYFWVYAGYSNARTNKHGDSIGQSQSAVGAFTGIVAK